MDEPQKGLAKYRAIGAALDVRGQTSAIVPDPMLIPGLPKRPAKNRQIAKAAILLERADPRMNNAKRGKLVR